MRVKDIHITDHTVYVLAVGQHDIFLGRALHLHLHVSVGTGGTESHGGVIDLSERLHNIFLVLQSCLLVGGHGGFEGGTSFAELEDR